MGKDDTSHDEERRNEGTNDVLSFLSSLSLSFALSASLLYLVKEV